MTPTALHIGKYQIDPALFEQGFASGCGPFACESTCCAGGVYLDPAEKERILANKEIVKKYMDETQLKDEKGWFDNEIIDDSDFPSGKALGTEVVNNKCVFLDKSGRCSLQRAGTEEKLGRWALKPFFCVAFPITVEDNVVIYDDFPEHKPKCCAIVADPGSSLIEACKEELEFVLGHEGYKTLLQLKTGPSLTIK
ncbi:MAG TPA: DUF3109 family protein [Bacteroidota bacterium]|nr:DUF3109 family protein [Bacteroidota bacterium]